MVYTLNTEARNIILCSDGTGNRGGFTPDSNVFRLYKALDLRGRPSQVVFYDNGVGTSSNRYLAAITGAFGFGFGRNVRDLYTFLARNYRPGDRIFLFGFSRGAATVRAFSGFVATCGLIDGHAMTDAELERETLRKFRQYRDGKPDLEEQGLHPDIKITFIGVWDTVSALGFPRRTDITSTFMNLLNRAFVALDKVTDHIPWLSHNFYKYGITDNIENACQALALDDARTSFWPEVWHERAGQQTNLHQVWFVGSHSNVGGGYRRSGLADVAFEWMVTQATRCGLRLKPGEPEVIHADANAHGKYFDSRDGFGMFYRYHPRRLTEELYLAPRDQGYDFTIYVHESVLERIHYRTANYSPLSLPTKFSVVNDDREVIANLDFSGDEQWHRERLRLDRAIFQGKWLYGLMLELALALIAAAVYVWIWPPSVIDIQSTKHEWLVSTLFYATPAMFENFIRLLVQVYPLLGASLVTTGVAWFLYNRRTISRTQKIAEQLALIVKRRFADKTLGENEKDQ